MQIKRTAIAAVACLALGGLAACGDDGSGGGSNAGKSNGVEKLTAKQIRDKAQSALDAAESVHVVIKSKESGGDMTIGHGGDCKGSLSLARGAQADFVRSGGVTYLKATRAFWAEVAADRADAIESTVGDRYLKSSGGGTDFGVNDDFCNAGSAMSPGHNPGSSHVKLAKGGVSTVDGVRCVEVTASGSGGDTEHEYVATTGKPYPIRLTGTIDGEQSTATLTDYGKQVSIQAPPAGQVVDASKIPDSTGS